MGEFRETVETILVEESARGDEITARVLAAYPAAGVLYYKGGNDAETIFSLSHYPKKTLVLKRHRGRFVKPFPKHPWYCDGDTANLILGHGCFASCLYCFVPTYFDDPFPTLFTNTEDALAELKIYLEENPRSWVSTGEFLDSLQLDRITRYTEQIMDCFGKFPGARLELRTKHSGVEHLPENKHPGVVFSFSVNPELVVRQVEPGSADLERRLSAAEYLYGRGYRIALRIDPIIATTDYLETYDDLADTVEKLLGWGRVTRVFLGALRFDVKLMRRLARGPAARKLLDAEYVLAPDGKYRLYKHARVAVYRRLADRIKRHNPKITVTLMMEPDYVNKAVLGAG